MPAVLARQHSCVPIMSDHGELLMASPNPLVPDVEEELRLRIGMPVRTIICTPAEVHAAVAKYYSKETAAAQMAAGVATGTAPASVATPDSKAKAAKAAEDSDAAPVADKATMKKRQQMGAGFGFMWAFIGLMLAGNLAPRLAKNWGLGSNMKLIGVALAAGIVAAGIGFIIGGLFKRA